MIVSICSLSYRDLKHDDSEQYRIHVKYREYSISRSTSLLAYCMSVRSIYRLPKIFSVLHRFIDVNHK